MSSAVKQNGIAFHLSTPDSYIEISSTFPVLPKYAKVQLRAKTILQINRRTRKTQSPVRQTEVCTMILLSLVQFFLYNKVKRLAMIRN